MKNSVRVKQVVSHFPIGEIIKITPLGEGAINETYFLETKDQKKYVLQKLHPIFKPEVLEDIEVVTKFLKEKGAVTPTLIKTKNGDLGFTDGEKTWRVMSFIPGVTIESNLTPEIAFEAASLIGQFHKLLSTLEYNFKHQIPHFHDTPFIMKKLEDTLKKYQGAEKYQTLSPSALEVLKWSEDLDYQAIKSLPTRVIHADLKISNIRFDPSSKKAIALLDLDTLGNNKIVMDLGDAARSWCNPLGEDKEKTFFDLAIFEALVKGYLSTAKDFITEEEVKNIPNGAALLLIEQSARFLTDAFEESYYVWDKKKYPSLYEQNRIRALSQMNAYRDFLKQKDQITI